jgi:hypothetical protein
MRTKSGEGHRMRKLFEEGKQLWVLAHDATELDLKTLRKMFSFVNAFILVL